MLTGIYTKIIVGAVGIIALLSLLLYVSHLQNKNEKLTNENNNIKIELNMKEELLKEIDRRDDALDLITKYYNKESNKLEIVYRNKEEKVDREVREGKDREVGEILSNYFNGD